MPQYDTTDEKIVNDSKARAGMRSAKIDSAFREVSNTVEGRTLLWSILERAQIFMIPEMDPMLMAFHNGKRSIGLDLMRLFDRVAPGSFVIMQKENTEQPKVQDNARDRDETSSDD